MKEVARRALGVHHSRMMGFFFVGFAALFLWVMSRPGEVEVKFGSGDDTDIGEL